MSVTIVDRFEAGEPLDESDRLALRNEILAPGNEYHLPLVINTYFEAFSCDATLLNHLKGLLTENPQPNIAAACLKAIIEHCPEGIEKSLQYARPFVDFSLLEGWVDEVIYSANFFKRNLDALSPFDRKRLQRLVEEASAGGAPEIVNLLTL